MDRNIYIKILREDGSDYNFLSLPYSKRNFDWFDSISFYTKDCLYNNFPACIGVPDNCTSRQALDDYQNDRYFDFWHMRVSDFRKWYNTVKPYEVGVLNMMSF